MTVYLYALVSQKARMLSSVAAKTSNLENSYGDSIEYRVFNDFMA